MMLFLLLGLSLLASTVNAVSLLPGFVSNSYSTTVEISFGALGYTLSYDEYWSARLQLLRTDGRYNGPNIIELTQFGSATNNRTRDNIKVIDRSGTASQECTGFYLYGTQNSSLMYQPSFAIWELLNFTGFSWTNMGNDTMGDRQKDAVKFETGVYTITWDDQFCYGSSCSGGNSGLETPDWDVLELIDFAYGTDPNRYDTTFKLTYFVEQTSDTVTIPLRLIVEGTRTNVESGVAKAFSNNYDWVNFHRLDDTVITSLRNLYWNCMPNATEVHRRLPFPTSNTVRPATYSVGQIPPVTMFPNEMYMVFEGLPRIAAGPPINNLRNQNVAMKWVLDQNGMQEAVTVHGTFNNTGAKTIYRYNDASSFPFSGRVYTITGTSSRPQCTTQNLSFWGPNANWSPTRIARSDFGTSIADFFVGARVNIADYHYVGRTTIRSVEADAWSATFSGENGWNNTQRFTYTSTVYTTPEGWQFPGRRTADIGIGLPILIVNEGQTTGFFNYTYRDTWNIFELIPAGVTDSSWWTEIPEAFNCATYPPGQNSTTPTPPPTFQIPYFNPDYQSTVEQTYSDIGITVSYEEFSQASNKMLRADGRYGSRSVVEITNWNQAPAVMSTYDSIDGSCRQYQLEQTAQQNSLLYQPSGTILTMLNYTGLRWQMSGFNQGIPDRNVFGVRYYIPLAYVLPNGVFCDAEYRCSNNTYPDTEWSFIELLDPSLSKSQHVGQTQDPDQPTYTYTLHFEFWVDMSRKTGLIGATPLRLQVNGTRYMVIGDDVDPFGETFTNTIDWVNWRSVDTTAITSITTSSKYKPCTPTGAYVRGTFPNSTAVGPTTIPIGSAPDPASFPSQFVMMVEGRLRAGGFGGSNYAVKWSYDMPSLQESVTTSGSNYSGSAYPTTFLYQWGDAYDGGAAWQVDGPLDHPTCALRDLTNSTVNPLQSSYGGLASFVQLFKDVKYDLSQLRYRGRSLQRGVAADQYVAQYTDMIAADPALARYRFSYNLTVYMYPPGWAMVGRETATTLNLPFRVTFAINMRDTVNPRNSFDFTDVYNIFELFPASDVMRSGGSGIVDSSWFSDTPSAYSCPIYQKKSSSSSSLGSGAIAGIVIGVLIGVALLCLLAFYLVRAPKSSGKSTGTFFGASKFSKHTDEESEMSEMS